MAWPSDGLDGGRSQETRQGRFGGSSSKVQVEGAVDPRRSPPLKTQEGCTWPKHANSGSKGNHQRQRESETQNRIPSSSGWCATLHIVQVSQGEEFLIKGAALEHQMPVPHQEMATGPKFQTVGEASAVVIYAQSALLPTLAKNAA